MRRITHDSAVVVAGWHCDGRPGDVNADQKLHLTVDFCWHGVKETREHVYPLGLQFQEPLSGAQVALLGMAAGVVTMATEASNAVADSSGGMSIFSSPQNREHEDEKSRKKAVQSAVKDTLERSLPFAVDRAVRAVLPKAIDRAMSSTSGPMIEGVKYAAETSMASAMERALRMPTRSNTEDPVSSLDAQIEHRVGKRSDERRDKVAMGEDCEQSSERQDHGAMIEGATQGHERQNIRATIEGDSTVSADIDKALSVFDQEIQNLAKFDESLGIGNEILRRQLAGEANEPLFPANLIPETLASPQSPSDRSRKRKIRGGRKHRPRPADYQTPDAIDRRQLITQRKSLTWVKPEVQVEREIEVHTNAVSHLQRLGLRPTDGGTSSPQVTKGSVTPLQQATALESRAMRESSTTDITRLQPSRDMAGTVVTQVAEQEIEQSSEMELTGETQAHRPNPNYMEWKATIARLFNV